MNWLDVFKNFFKSYDICNRESDTHFLNEKFDGGIVLPNTLEKVKKVFGDPKVFYRKGKIVVNKKWERENFIVLRNLPFGIKKKYVHKKAAPYFHEALKRAEKHPENNGSFVIKTFGVFNPRHQRHNRSRPLSDHTWGIACDINAPENRPKIFSENLLKPIPFSELWYDIWPQGIPEWFVLSFESVGFDWGGRWKKFVDPQHFSLRQV